MIDMTENPTSTLRNGVLELAIKNFADALSREFVWKMRNAIHVLHHHALQSLGDRRYTAELEQSFRELLGLYKGLFTLLEETRDTTSSVGFNKQAMLFGSASDIASSLEEFFTGEDPLLDMLMNGIPFILGRLSEHSYVRSAEVGLRSVLGEHSLELYDRFWELAKKKERGREHPVSYEDSRTIGEGMAALATLLSDERLSHHERLQLHALLYVVLINKTVQDLDKQLAKI